MSPCRASLVLTLLALGLPLAAAARKLDSATASQGLRAALEQGTLHAVDELGRTDGFRLHPDPDVRIELPGELRSVARLLRGVGQGRLVDDFETSMNRAAEAAVPLARDAFLDAIRAMKFSDAWDVLTGGEHAATDYLREHAGPRLQAEFRPIVAEKLQLVGATRDFDELMQRTAALPFGGGKPVFELDEHVTAEALDGLFRMVEREEEEIRKNPIRRGSALLRKVFGSKQAKAAVGR
jgi:hypothetical protein